MKKYSPFTQSFKTLPGSLPVFPLPNAVVFPGGLLPLNIFEPRYLNMVKDAMKNEQLLGMVQTSNAETPPELYKTGCAARIIRYEETSDGRLEILLAGICRFDISEELSSIRGYRLVVPNWERFALDYNSDDPAKSQSILLFNAAIRKYFTGNKIDVDWGSIEQISHETLVNNLVGQLPISVADKQFLLEASNIEERTLLFVSILEASYDDSQPKH